MKKKGAAALIVLIVMSVVFIMAAMMIDISSKNNKAVRMVYESKQAYYSAEAGLNDIVRYILDNYDEAQKNDSIEDNTLFGKSSASYNARITDIEKADNNYIFNIISNGTFRQSGSTIDAQIVVKTKLVDNGSGDSDGNSGVGNGNGNAYGNKKPYFVIDDEDRIPAAQPAQTIYVEDNSNVNGAGNTTIVVEIKILKQAIKDYEKELIDDIEEQITSYKNNAAIYNANNIDDLITKINTINSSHVIIRTDNLDIDKSATIGSQSEAVTLIVDNLNVNTSGTLNVFGDLIVLNKFNIDSDFNLKVSKVSQNYGNLYADKGIDLNDNGLFNIEDTFYAKSLTLGGSGNIAADRMIVAEDANFNGTIRITVTKDMAVGSLTCNNLTQIATGGDLVVYSDFSKNDSINLTAGGRICAGGNINFNGIQTTLSSGGQTTSLILYGEKGNGDGGGSGDSDYVYDGYFYNYIKTH